MQTKDERARAMDEEVRWVCNDTCGKITKKITKKFVSRGNILLGQEGVHHDTRHAGGMGYGEFRFRVA